MAEDLYWIAGRILLALLLFWGATYVALYVINYKADE